MKTLILLPTYNEKENVARLIPKIFSILPDISIMIIDDNSPDGTAQHVIQLQKTFPKLFLHRREKKEGLGRAYIDAFQKVLADPTWEVVCTMDADLSHDPYYLPPMLEKLKENDFIIGSRYVSGGTIAGWELWRKMLSAGGNIYCRYVTKMPIYDCTSGFGCIRTKILRKISFHSLDASGYAFLMALKYALWKQGARISEYPICFKTRLNGESKISKKIIQEGILLPWKMIRTRAHSMSSPACPVCESTATLFWFTKNKSDVYHCRACKLIFIHPLPATTSPLYSSDYFCGAEHGFGYVNYEEDKGPRSHEFGRYLDLIEAQYPSKGKLMDVGAATGSFLVVARDRGWDVAGLEISEYAADQGRKKGLAMITGALDSMMEYPPASFDVITLWDVFEHLPYPKDALDRIYALLKPNGLVVMNLPDAGSLYARSMGKRWALIIPPEHLRLFNIHNLGQILNLHHFSILHTDKIGKHFKPAYIFQILYTMRHQKLWKIISDWIRKTPLNRLSIPINTRDNMFIIARKQ